jgi:hypothetical protein
MRATGSISTNLVIEPHIEGRHQSDHPVPSQKALALDQPQSLEIGGCVFNILAVCSGQELAQPVNIEFFTT